MKRLKYLALASLVAFAACDEGTTVDGGDTAATGTVTVSVTAESAGLANVQVNLVGPTSASQTTGASGSVTFSNVAQGAYAVTISNVPAGYICGSTSQTTSITESQLTASLSFGCSVVRSASISGQVTADGDAVEGAVVTITGPEIDQDYTTGADGRFQETGLIAGSYTIMLNEADIGGIECEESTQTRTLTAGGSAVANFSCGGEVEPATVVIERIETVGGVAVNREMVSGIIVVRVGVEEGGQDVDELNVYANGILVCSQSYDEGSAVGPMAQEDEFEVDCVFNTAAVRNIDGEATGQFAGEAADGNPFSPIFLNGEIDIVAEAVTADPDDNDPTATAEITLVNNDALALNVENDNPEAPDFIIDTDDGLRWLSGSFTFTVYPVIYSAPHDPNDPAIARSNFWFDSYVSNEDTDHFTNDSDPRPDVGEDAIPAGWRLSNTTPNADGSFTFTLSDATLTGSTNGDGVFIVGNGGGIDDIITGDIGAQNITIQTVTSFGQFGPGVTCENITTTCVGTGSSQASNPLLVFYDGVLQSGTGAFNNVLRIDNQEPWVNVIGLDPHPLESMFGGAVDSEGILVNGERAVRGGLNLNGQKDGWVNHEYEFDSGMWESLMATDAPNFYASHPYFTLPSDITPSVTELEGIGVDGSMVWYFAHESDDSNSPSAFTVSGLSGAQRVRNVSDAMGCDESNDGPCQVETGADLPGDEGPGLADLDYPNSNENDDISMVGVIADLFANAGITNILEIAVDGHAPEFRNDVGASGSSPIFPTTAGTIYNTYGDEQASNPSNIDATGQSCSGTPPDEVCTYDKTAGEFEGTLTDAGNGFSGAAGVSLRDWENGCESGVLACAIEKNERFGVTLQDESILAPTAYLYWNWSADDVGNSTFLSSTGALIEAYDAEAGVRAENDGYRQQQGTGYDRAANSEMTAEVTEHIADKSKPDNSNVVMPGVVQFVLGSDYTFGGTANDQVDLFYSDFVFDFNSIRSIQAYADRIGDSADDPFAPNEDFNNQEYLSNESNGGDCGTCIESVGNSLQLPLADEMHTAFGSAAIVLETALSETVEFIGCVALFDDGGAPDDGFEFIATYDDDDALDYVLAESSDPDYVHIPRGPRWRVWGHEYPQVPGSGAEYGLINTEFNTFAFGTIPHDDSTTCDDGSSADDIRDEIFPSANGAGNWEFALEGGDLIIRVRGQSGTFVPDFDITDFDLYYIDIEGRVRILDLSGDQWTGPFVEDLGTGALGRSYTYTYGGTLPTNTMVPEAHDGSDNRHRLAYFFTVRLNDGRMIMWDDSATDYVFP